MSFDKDLDALYKHLNTLDSSFEPKSTSYPKNTKNNNDAQTILASLGLTKDSICNQDLTLGEYLEKFSNKAESNNIVKNNLSTEIEELLGQIDDELKKEDDSETMFGRDIFSNKKSVVVKESGKFIGRTYTSDNVFSNLKKEVRQSAPQRIAKFANTEARVTSERKQAPLRLPQYMTD